MKTIKTILACLFLTGLLATVQAQQKDKIPHQTEEEFQKLLPITGTVETMGGNFKLDHSFPGEAGSPTCVCMGLKNQPLTTSTNSRPLTRSRISRNTSNRPFGGGRQASAPDIALTKFGKQ